MPIDFCYSKNSSLHQGLGAHPIDEGPAVLYLGLVWVLNTTGTECTVHSDDLHR